jgi:dephospho-CoA kinase
MALFSAALTGGVAEGKTTVLRMLSEFGLSTASADEVASDVLADPVVQHEVSSAFGLEPPFDRRELGAIVAGDPGRRRALNEIVHPEVFSRLVEIRADVVEVPLLLETCIQAAFGRIWVVTCSPEERLRRLTERLGDRERAQRLVASQLASEVKLAFADRTIRTDRPLDSVQRDVEELARSLVSR